MRILFFLNYFPLLSETFILNQITGLIDRGHQVDLLTRNLGDTSKVHEEVERYGLLKRVCHLPQNTYPHRRYAHDIIHCHFGPVGLHGARLHNLGYLSGKLVTSFYGYDLTRIPYQRGTNVYEDLFKIGDLYITSSDYLRMRAELLGCPQDKTAVLPVGLDPAKYTYKSRVLRPGEPVRILTVGRLVEKKGIEYGVRAVARVVRSYPNLQYQIVGDGPLREPLRTLISTLGLSRHVQLLGAKTQAELKDLYADSHLFMLASVTADDGDTEGQALVLQEAQAVGLPILSTRHNGIPEGVLDGQSGILVPERDVDALANELESLINARSRWADMGRIGHAYVRNRYDNNRLIDRLVTMYKSLVFLGEEKP